MVVGYRVLSLGDAKPGRVSSSGSWVSQGSGEIGVNAICFALLATRSRSRTKPVRSKHNLHCCQFHFHQCIVLRAYVRTISKGSIYAFSLRFEIPLIFASSMSLKQPTSFQSCSNQENMGADTKFRIRLLRRFL
jgi:hypothetical protein